LWEPGPEALFYPRIVLLVTPRFYPRFRGLPILMQRKVLRWHPASSLVFKWHPFGVSSQGFSKTYPRFFQRGNRFRARYTGKIIEKFIQRPAMLDVISEGLKRHSSSAKNGLAA
jgi:hypothetical protein